MSIYNVRYTQYVQGGPSYRLISVWRPLPFSKTVVCTLGARSRDGRPLPSLSSPSPLCPHIYNALYDPPNSLNSVSTANRRAEHQRTGRATLRFSGLGKNIYTINSTKKSWARGSEFAEGRGVLGLSRENNLSVKCGSSNVRRSQSDRGPVEIESTAEVWNIIERN